MIIQPKIRGFICTTAHPRGCEKSVLQQIEYVKSQPKISGAQHVLIIGASTGYGLASRIVATYACDASTIGVAYEKPADEKRTATAGWYNTAAFEKFALQDGYTAKSINADAFQTQTKTMVCDLIREHFGKIDLLIYSLAAPRRISPQTGEVYSSVLKPIGHAFHGKTVDAFRGELKDVAIEPGDENEIINTVKVMGGEDWQLWVDALQQQNLLANHFKTLAYSYIGPSITHAIYRDGTVGRAKLHLKATADKLSQQLKSINGEALVSVNKAVVTQASAAIPVVPLYIALLFKMMKANGTHEGCVEQIYRLFKDHVYAEKPLPLDQEGYIRIDDLEMNPAMQKEIANTWSTINAENLRELTDLAGYAEEFYHLFGFNFNDVDYNADVDPRVDIPSIDET